MNQYRIDQIKLTPDEEQAVQQKNGEEIFASKIRRILEKAGISDRGANEIEKIQILRRSIDGRGGATGSSPLFLREATSIPTIYALSRARRYLDSIQSDIALVITGGLRVSADFAKALAMGADAIAVATAPLIAAACQQYRICGSGYCPVGIATQNPMLRERLKIEEAAQRIANYLILSNEELKTFARVSGLDDVHKLSLENLVTLDEQIAKYTGIVHAGAPQL